MTDINEFSQGDLFICGEKGSGKSMYAMKLIQAYLNAGRPVATNLNVYLDELHGSQNELTVIRIPDKPTGTHLEQLGDAYRIRKDSAGFCVDNSIEPCGYNESRFGLIVLDECLTWLNSRGWQDKERAKTLDWFLHARKHGWNIAFLMQSADYCDPQLRETMLTYHVQCRKMGKYKIPFIGKLFGLRMPKGTLATITAGYGPTAIPHDREVYRGSDLYKSYDTDQIFESGFEFHGSDMVDMRASYTMLSAYLLKGRYEAPLKAEQNHHSLPIQLVNRFIWHVVRPLFFLAMMPFYPAEVKAAYVTTKYKLSKA